MKFKLLGILGLCFCGMASAQDSFEIITLRYRQAAELVSVLEPFAGPTGKVRGSGIKLVVMAPPENMKQIKQVIAELDRKSRMLRVCTRHRGNSTDNHEQASASVQATSQKIQAQGRVGESKVSNVENSTSCVMIAEGAPGAPSTSGLRMGKWAPVGSVRGSVQEKRRGILSRENRNTANSDDVEMKVEVVGD